MKITCLQENLKSGLNIVQNIIGRNLTLPILNNLLLETELGRLKISSTNLEIGINTWISGKIEKQGAITCPAKILSGFINNLPNKKIELETKDNNLFIKCEGYKANIKGLSVEDFPIIPKIKEKPIFIFKKSDILRNGLNQVIGAAAISESRPEISGILFYFNKEVIKLVATDSFRLAEKTIYQSDSLVDKPIYLIIPQRTAQELIRILNEKPDQELKVILGNNQILFELNEVQLISRLIDGQYPDYQQIIPKNFKTKVFVLKDEIINNIRIASIFSSKINDIKLLISPGKIEILAKDPDLGENQSQILTKTEGENLEINFNFKYLLDGLANISTKQVFLGLNSESSPAIIRPVQEQDYLYVVMPIKTS